MIEQFESFSSELVNLTELVYTYDLIPVDCKMGSEYKHPVIKFNNGFFKQMKSLKKFVTNNGNIVCCDSDDVVIEYI